MDAKTFTPSNQRILDLLRYARQELYMANLLSDEEYFEIATDHPAVERLESYDAARKRIRELEAEIAVRDNMGNEVLRILREATGRRDFHSEMEAAEHAAKMLAEARRDGARYRHLRDRGFQFADVSMGEDHRHEPFVRFRPSFDIKEPASFPNCYEDEEWTPSMIDAAIDAAMKEAK